MRKGGLSVTPELCIGHCHPREKDIAAEQWDAIALDQEAPLMPHDRFYGAHKPCSGVP
jgi:hypothetical protein